MTNANPTLPTTYGTILGVPIVGNVNSATLASLLYVTLSQNYVRTIPTTAPGYVDPNPGIAQNTSFTAYPQTIPSGTRLQFFSDEANAIVAAGGGTLT